MTPRRELIGKPDARAEAVEDLVRRALHGEIRVPAFQRGLKWQSKDVVELFDSIYRGFPIGSLLVRQGHADAARFSVGPLEVSGEESSHAWWVVDGQQRLTALAAGLGRPAPFARKPVDPYVVYLDPDIPAFQFPANHGEIPTRWVPIPLLLDASALQEWMMTWSHRTDPDLRRIVFEVGKRLREYRVPVYVIDTDDEDVLRSIFHRVNNTGKPLTWDEVHDALYGHRGAEPSSLAELGTRLEAVGMGRPDESTQLLPCLIAYRGADVTRSLGEHLRDDPKFLDGVVAASLPILREVLGFLRARAEIPHLRLLPVSTPLVVLTRFFQQHPSPSERSLMLLVRWVWRSFVSTAHDDHALKRRGVSSISHDEEASVQALLALVGEEPTGFEIADQFDARSAHSRIILLAMASLRPMKLEDGSRVNIAVELQDRDAAAFRALFPLHGDATRSPANRLLMPGPGSAAASLRDVIATGGPDQAILRSHAITPEVAEAIAAHDEVRAIYLRAKLLEGAVLTLSHRLAEWGRTDRPSIQYVLELGAER